eukprot:s1644_g9.t1
MVFRDETLQDQAKVAALARAKGQPLAPPSSAVQSSVPVAVVKTAFALKKGELSDLVVSEVDDRGAAGQLGGWFESAKDVMGKWVFLKEVSLKQTIPKMDHLTCFLPGTLALDVFHHAMERYGPRSVQPHLLEKDRAAELTLAHKLTQTCVHMYFRTSTDMAPEITRFNGHGLQDDQLSMHNILRPETVESLYLMWRTTKLQIYRNWGQRLLSAFYRRKTPYGFCSLHNVNKASSKRDDMPSFFTAETLKYLFLLFSSDSALPLDHFVLSTEAHPVPVMPTLKRLGVQWPCDLNVNDTAAPTPSSGAGGTFGSPAPAEELLRALQVMAELLDGGKPCAVQALAAGV